MKGKQDVCIRRSCPFFGVANMGFEQGQANPQADSFLASKSSAAE
jgi:hypothetical protein